MHGRCIDDEELPSYGYGQVLKMCIRDSRNGKTTRPHLKPGGCFTVRLRAKKEAPKEAAFFLPLTLQALGLFGAAGSRSRNGFGSLSLESLTCNDEEIWKAPTTLEELKKCQKTLLNNIKLSKNNDSLPEYTAFSNQSRVWIAQALSLIHISHHKERRCYSLWR